MPRRRRPKLVVDLSSDAAIARTAEAVASALAAGHLSGRAGQALVSAIRIAVEARKPAPPPPAPPPDGGPLITLHMAEPTSPRPAAAR
jgi:hypothetical protein